MQNRYFLFLSGNFLLSFAAGVFAYLIPSYGRLRKYRHLLLTARAIYKKQLILKSMPVHVRLAPVSSCNYRCLFCEIHSLDKAGVPHQKTCLTLEDFKAGAFFLSAAYSLDFYGGAAEPLLNPHLGTIVTYLKKSFNPHLMVNTNASLLTPSLAEVFVRQGFDSILVSYHAASEGAYRQLTQTGRVGRVDENLTTLYQVKKLSGKRKPMVELCLALHRENAREVTAVLDKAKQFGADSVIINRYYGGHNAYLGKEVGFENNPEEGNRMLDTIYSHAVLNGIQLKPSVPSYWSISRNPEWNEGHVAHEKNCFFPWTSLIFDPVLHERNAFYVGVCNRIALFKVDWGQMGPEMFNALWNHPILLYLRGSVNGPDLNPICRYCKNRDREALRNLMPERYAEIRDNAVFQFFKDFRKLGFCPEVPGLSVLERNPFSSER